MFSFATSLIRGRGSEPQNEATSRRQREVVNELACQILPPPASLPSQEGPDSFPELLIGGRVRDFAFGGTNANMEANLAYALRSTVNANSEFLLVEQLLFIGLFREVLITVLHDAERVISQIEGSRVL